MFGRFAMCQCIYLFATCICRIYLSASYKEQVGGTRGGHYNAPPPYFTRCHSCLQLGSECRLTDFSAPFPFLVWVRQSLPEGKKRFKKQTMEGIINLTFCGLWWPPNCVLFPPLDCDGLRHAYSCSNCDIYIECPTFSVHVLL